MLLAILALYGMVILDSSELWIQAETLHCIYFHEMSDNDTSDVSFSDNTTLCGLKGTKKG